jgi:hypothetical protein
MSQPVQQHLGAGRSNGRKVPPALDYRDEVTAEQRKQIKELEGKLGVHDACWKQDGDAAW